MAKPPFDEDEEDALSLVMGEPAAAPEESEGGELDALPAEGAEEAEEPPKSDASQVLDEVLAKLEELRGLVTA